jgi:hypothetical protein
MLYPGRPTLLGCAYHMNQCTGILFQESVFAYREA